MTILCDTPVAMRSILGTEPERDERGKGMGRGEEGSVEPLFVMFLAEVSECMYLIFLAEMCDCDYMCISHLSYKHPAEVSESMYLIFLKHACVFLMSIGLCCWLK